MQTQQWTTNHGEEEIEPEFRPQDILNLHRIILDSNAHFEAYFQLHKIKPLVLYYEDVLGQEREVLDLVTSYLGIQLTKTVEREEELTVKKQRTSRNSEWEDRMREQYALRIGPLP